MSLEDEIKHHIREKGAMDVATFMGLALGHPQHGYYMKQDPLGAAGDFTTAPEISQMFGEMIGAWCADIWSKMGKPARFVLCECGPGRGTLMADALRATQKAAGFHDALELHLVETSPVLKEKQAQALSSYAPLWHDTLAGLPVDVPLILIANELLDALPVQQAVWTGGAWHRRAVALDENGALSFGVGEALPLDAPAGAEDGAIFEYAPARELLVETVALRLKKQGGAALFIDYGHAKTAIGDTLQAMKDHEFVDVLSHIGDADLTSHVDFDALGRVARRAGAVCHGPVPQGVFLQRLGMGQRAAMLRQNAEPAQQQQIDTAFARLTGKNEMGELFKVMALCHDESLLPEGLSQDVY